MKDLIATIKSLLFEFKYFILVMFLILVITNIPLPYYIYTPGGIDNIESKYEVTDSYESKGSFNMAYVGSMEADVLLYLTSFFIPSWEVVKYDDVILDNEDVIDDNNRDILYMEESKQNAVINAYEKAGKEYKISKTHYKVFYITESAKTELKIADELLEIDNMKIDDDIVSDYLANKKVGDKITLKILRNDKEKFVTSTIGLYKNNKVIGINIIPIYDFKTDPAIEFKFPENETGPSAGFLLAISIYDSLIKEDLTKGYKITGTGTIDEQGNVGEIGSVEKKLQSAVKGKSDIFLVPTGDNYKDAKKLAKEKNYKIKIVEIKTFDDAIKYLEKLKQK